MVARTQPVPAALRSQPQAADDPHARRTGTCFAAHGLHPSADGYRHCFESLKRQLLHGAQVLRRAPTLQETHHAECV